LYHRFSDSRQTFGAAILWKSSEPSEVQRVVPHIGADNSLDFVFNHLDQLGPKPLWLSAVCWQFGHLRNLAKSKTIRHTCMPQPNRKRTNVKMLNTAGRPPISNQPEAKVAQLLQFFLQQVNPAFSNLMSANHQIITD
jgi:hypothetical protein